MTPLLTLLFWAPAGALLAVLDALPVPPAVVEGNQISFWELAWIALT